MKILLLYTPRCGSTSILKYFEKIKTEYECFNEPWFEWMVKNVHKNKSEYLDLITKKNIFVKSAYKTLPVSLDVLLNDFDKIDIVLKKAISDYGLNVELYLKDSLNAIAVKKANFSKQDLNGFYDNYVKSLNLEYRYAIEKMIENDQRV